MPDLINDEIRCGVLIRAAPERVYDAVATAEGLDGWFTCGATVDARPGGKIRFRWKDFGVDRITGEDGGPVLEARRPNRFVFRWHPDNSSYSTTVEISIEPAEGGSVVRLREHGYQDTPSGLRAMLDCATGWGEALALLKVHAEHGVRY